MGDVEDHNLIIMKDLILVVPRVADKVNLETEILDLEYYRNL